MDEAFDTLWHSPGIAPGAESARYLQSIAQPVAYLTNCGVGIRVESWYFDDAIADKTCIMVGARAS